MPGLPPVLVTTRLSLGSSPKRVTTVCSNRCELVRPVGISKDPRQWAPRLPGLHARLIHWSYAGVPTKIGRALVGEHERIVGKLNGRQFLRVHHHLERFNPLTYRGGSRRIGGRGRPHSEPTRHQKGGKGKQGGVAHLSAPVQLAQDGSSSHSTGGNMPDQRFGRCDCHHKMVDFIG